MNDQKNSPPFRFLFPVLAIAFFLFICWIIIRADQGQSHSLVKQIRLFPYSDKVAHFILYGILAFLVNLALNHKRVKMLSFSILLGSLLVGAFAIAEEFTQIGLASRSFEWIDMLSDLLGITLFSYLSLWFGRRMQQSRSHYWTNIN